MSFKKVFSTLLMMQSVYAADTLAVNALIASSSQVIQSDIQQDKRLLLAAIEGAEVTHLKKQNAQLRRANLFALDIKEIPDFARVVMVHGLLEDAYFSSFYDTPNERLDALNHVLSKINAQQIYNDMAVAPPGISPQVAQARVGVANKAACIVWAHRFIAYSKDKTSAESVNFVKLMHSSSHLQHLKLTLNRVGSDRLFSHIFIEFILPYIADRQSRFEKMGLTFEGINSKNIEVERRIVTFLESGAQAKFAPTPKDAKGNIIPLSAQKKKEYVEKNTKSIKDTIIFYAECRELIKNFAPYFYDQVENEVATKLSIDASSSSSSLATRCFVNQHILTAYLEKDPAESMSSFVERFPMATSQHLLAVLDTVAQSRQSVSKFGLKAAAVEQRQVISLIDDQQDWTQILSLEENDDTLEKKPSGEEMSSMVAGPSYANIYANWEAIEKTYAPSIVKSVEKQVIKVLSDMQNLANAGSQEAIRFLIDVYAKGVDFKKRKGDRDTYMIVPRNQKKAKELRAMINALDGTPSSEKAAVKRKLGTLLDSGSDEEPFVESLEKPSTQLHKVARKKSAAVSSTPADQQMILFAGTEQEIALPALSTFDPMVDISSYANALYKIKRVVDHTCSFTSQMNTKLIESARETLIAISDPQLKPHAERALSALLTYQK